MHNQKKFDEILKNKLDSQEFPFDETNWKKAAAMIDESRKDKKRLGFWLFSSLIVLTCGVIGVYTFNSLTSTNNTQISQNVNTIQTNAELLSKSIVIPKVNENLDNNTNAETASISEVRPETEKQTATDFKSEKTSEIKSETSTKTLTKKAESDRNTIGKDKFVPSESSNKNVASENKRTEQKTIPPLNKNTGVDKPSADKEADDIKPVLAKSETADTDNGVAAIEKSEVLIAAIDTLSKEPEKSLKIDTAALAEASKPIVVPPLIKNYVSFEAGADYLLGWKNPGSTDANGFNPIVGINYTHFFNKRIGFTIGAQYNTVGNLSYSNHTSMVTSYTFGQENDITIITPVKLHYAVMPLKFNFALNPNNIIGIGCNVAYLLNVENKVETYNERLNYTSEHSVSKTKGYVSGIKNFDTQLSVFYRKTIYKELSVNAELLYGLTDIKDNTFFNSNVYERNVGFKLTLVLNAFKK